MTTITQELVRELALFEGDTAPVTSCYLDVDGRRYVRPLEYELELAGMLRRAREQADGHGRHVADDLRRIEEHVKRGMDRSRTRGLVMFSCAAHGLWRALELPVAVRNQIVVERRPHVTPLERVLDTSQRFGVLLADRQRARMFVFQLGELVDRSETFDRLPRHDDDGGEWDRDHVRDHAAVAARHHLRRAARVAFEVHKEHGFDHLVLGAPEELVGELERELHSYIRDRIVARLTVPAGASVEEVRQAVMAVEADVGRTAQARAVQRLRDAVGSGNGGVAGLARVLSALVERRVETLLVSEGFQAAGFRCPGCSFVAAKGRTCPVCATPMDRLDDVVEAAVSEAVAQSCRVEVCRDDADLDVLGRIGAVLRF